MKWEHSVNIKSIFAPYLDLEGDVPLETLQSIGNQIADVLEANSCFEDFGRTEEFRELVDVEDFDDLMEDLYNYSDTYRIWLGVE